MTVHAEVRFCVLLVMAEKGQGQAHANPRPPTPCGRGRNPAPGEKGHVLSNRRGAHGSLPAMTGLTDFLTHAFKTIARAVAETDGNAGLFKQPELVPKTVKRRVSAELKRPGVLLRHLIFLMALQVGLAPLVPRPASNYFETSEGEPEARKAFFSVLPILAREAPDFLHGPVIVPTCGPVPAAPLIARWEAMLYTLKYRQRRARCLARTIQRGKAAGEARPFITPIPKAHTMPAALGLVLGGLTVRLIEALKNWPDFDTS